MYPHWQNFLWFGLGVAQSATVAAFVVDSKTMIGEILALVVSIPLGIAIGVLEAAIWELAMGQSKR